MEENFKQEPVYQRESFSKETKQYIQKRSGGWCEVCGIFPYKEIHHIVPVCVGGNNEHINLAALCRLCHVNVPGDHPDGYEDEFWIYRDNGGPLFSMFYYGYVFGKYGSIEKMVASGDMGKIHKELAKARKSVIALSRKLGKKNYRPICFLGMAMYGDIPNLK